MNKEGVSLIVLTVVVCIMGILSLTVISTSFNISEGYQTMRFEKEIEMVEKKVRIAYLENKTYGTNISSLASTEPYATFIREIQTKYSVNLTSKNYYILTSQDLKNMGIKRTKFVYAVNYQKGIVLNVLGMIKEGEKVYTNFNIVTTDF